MATLNIGEQAINVAAGRAFANWTETEGAALVRTAKSMAPRRTGRLADSVHMVKVNQFAVSLVVDAQSDGNRTRLNSGGPFGSYAQAVIGGRKRVYSTTAWKKRYGGYGVLTPPPKMLQFADGRFAHIAGPARANDFLTRAVVASGLRITRGVR